jgi:hypothetical protein
MTKARTWSMSSSFRLVEGLPERASLSSDVRPSFNLLYHSLICVIFAENPLNLPNGFHLSIAKLLAKFDAIPLLESFRHFGRKLQCDACCVYTVTHTLAARDCGCLLAEKNPRMCMKVPPPPYHSTPPVLHYFPRKKITSDTF